MRRRLALAIPVAAILLASPLLAGCGASTDELNVDEGEPVLLGDVQYNVVISRFLNADDTEDAEYLVKQPPVGPDQLYLGVFMQVHNQGSAPSSLPSQMTVVDTEGKSYQPIESASPFALPLGTPLPPSAKFPVPDSTAATGPIEGSMVLFLINQASVEDRPLELQIPPTSGDPATVKLDI